MNSTTIVASIIAVIFALDKLGFLERLGLVRPSAGVAASELEIADRALTRKDHDLGIAHARIRELERTRSQEVVLEQIIGVTKLQSEIFERLVHHNGSFAHVEGSLRVIEESLKTLSGYILAANDDHT